jgi:hypothetical protein
MSPETLYHYIIVRRELSGGALLAQVTHAAGESASKWSLSTTHSLADTTRAAVLVASKEELESVLTKLAASLIIHQRIDETDGPLKGSTTSVGFIAPKSEFVKALVAGLKPWSKGP